MKKVNNSVFKRKMIHMSTSIIPVFYYFYLTKVQILIFISILTIIALLIEYLRKYNLNVKKLYLNYFSEMNKSDEIEGKLTGATYLFISSLITIALFPKSISVAAILFLTISDPLACLVGSNIGKIKIVGKKTLEGFIAFIFSGIIITQFISDLQFQHILIGVFIGGITELLPFNINDNLTIPISSGIIMYLLAI